MNYNPNNPLDNLSYTLTKHFKDVYYTMNRNVLYIIKEDSRIAIYYMDSSYVDNIRNDLFLIVFMGDIQKEPILFATPEKVIEVVLEHLQLSKI